MRRPAASFRAIVVAAVAGIFVEVALATSVGAQASSYTTSSYAARLLALVNQARQLYGERPLALAAGTTQIATAWTHRIADTRVLSHNPRLAHQLATHGSHNWLTYGENVGVGSSEEPGDLFDAYMKSPEHRANILDREYRFVGVSVVITGARAWNTFDFVDVYGTQPATHRRARPAIHAVAAPAETPSTPPVRPTERAARTAGPVVVHVEALRHAARPTPRRPALTIVEAALPVERSRAIALALAVLALSMAGRRWLLVATRPST